VDDELKTIETLRSDDMDSMEKGKNIFQPYMKRKLEMK